MTTAVYRFRPQAKPCRKLQRWLASNPSDVTMITDEDLRRPELIDLLTGIVSGTYDRVVVSRLSDLGMTAQRLVAFIEDCRSHDVTLISLKESFNLMTADGMKMAKFLVSVAEDEWETRAELQREGIQRAKAAGRVWRGRPVGTRVRVSEVAERRIHDLLATGTPVAEIARDAGVKLSVRTVYRVIAKSKQARA